MSLINFQNLGMTEEQARDEAIKRFYAIQEQRRKDVNQNLAASFYTGM